MATGLVTSLLCGLMGALVLASANEAGDVSKCEVRSKVTLPMKAFLSSLSRHRWSDFHVTAETRELQPNTTSSVISMKKSGRGKNRKYQMYTAVNVENGSGDQQCRSIRHVFTYNRAEHRLESVEDIFHMVLHVYMLAYDAVKGHVAFYVELLKAGRRMDSLNLIDVMTSDPSSPPTMSMAKMGVARICPSFSDVTNDVIALSVNPSLTAKCRKGTD